MPEEIKPNESILLSIATRFGYEDSLSDYKDDLIFFINSSFMILSQAGIGNVKGFRISDEMSKWKDFLGDDETLVGSVGEFIYLDVKLVFDPPSNSFVIESLKSLRTELITRLNWQVDYTPIEEDT